MNRKLYVGNLGFSVTEQEVRTLFSSYGEVSEVKMINDRETGRPRGFAFVNMSSSEAAGNALQALNGQLFQERKLVIDFARAEQRAPRQDRASFSRGGNSRDRDSYNSY